MLFLPIMASLGAINSATSLIQGGITAVQSGISMIGTIATKIFNTIGKVAVKIFNKIKAFYDKHLANIFNPMLKVAKNIFMGIFTFFINLVKGIVGAIRNIPSAFGTLKDGAISKLQGVKDFMASIPSFLVGKMRDGVSLVGKVISGFRKKLAGLRTFFADKFSYIFEQLMRPFKWIWDKITKIKNALTGALGKAFNKATSVFGGGGGGSTTNNSVGTAVSGGVSQHFTMNINVSGVTDRADKREIAREMSELMQEEVARSMGGTTTRSRYA